MKQWALKLGSILFSVFFGLAPLISNADVPIDRIVAIVDDAVITQSQLATQVIMTRAQLQQSNSPIPPDNVFRQQVLKHLIDEQLQVELAKKMSITVSDADLDQSIAQIAQQNGITLAQLQSKVVQQGMTYDQYRQQIRKQMTISQLQQHEVAPKITVRPQEIADVTPTLAKQPVSNIALYHLEDMVVILPQAPTPDQIKIAQQQAQDIVAKLHAGADFRQIVVAGATNKPPIQGGDLGWHKLSELPDLFVSYIAHLQAGDVAGPIRAPNGFHIVKLVEMRGGNPLVHQTVQTHVRHILIKITPLESDAQVKDRLARLRAAIANGVDFAKLATANSQDPGSAIKGGDLGWVNPGVLDPTFEAQMNQLKPGEISQPFKTQFGWHIVQVLERKTVQDSQAHLKDQAQQLVYQRKSQEAVENWLRGLRSQAYIKIFND